MFDYNECEIALINTEGLWYGLVTRKVDKLQYETLGYEKREEAKRMSKITAHVLKGEYDAQLQES